jgi:hypothetical protein
LNFRRSAHDSSATTLVKHEYAKIFPAVSVEAYVARKPNYVAYGGFAALHALAAVICTVLVRH